jgi:hypothetical protein
MHIRGKRIEISGSKGWFSKSRTEQPDSGVRGQPDPVEYPACAVNEPVPKLG